MIKVRLLSFYNENENSKYTIASLRLAAALLDIDALDVRIVPISLSINKDGMDKIIQMLNKDDIDILGMSAYVWTWDKIKLISHNFKRKKNTLVLVGGPEVINKERLDWCGDEIFSYGEGEYFTNQICHMVCDGLTVDEIKNKNIIADGVLQNGVYVISKSCKLFEKTPVFTEKTLEKLHITDFCNDYCYYETTRGCPYNCGYCGHKFRGMPVSFSEEFLCEEVKFFGRINLKRIFIIDPILGGTPSNGKRILKMFHNYAPDTQITAFLRPEYLDDEYLEILSLSNIEELRFGIQTINENVPDWIRANNVGKIVNILPKLSTTGIPWRAELITGLPGDDKEGFQNSLEFIIDKVHPTYVHSYHLTVLKETKMYELLDPTALHWIRINEKNYRAIESYSYTEEDMNWMIKFGVLVTSLYNSYVTIDTNKHKAHNNAPDFNTIKDMVEKHIIDFSNQDTLHYEDAVDYWSKILR